MIKFDKETIIEKFKSGEWMDKAQSCLKTPDSLKKLSDDLSGYMNKDGLKNVQSQLVQLYDYVKQLLTKGYYDYKDHTLVLIIAVIIYVVSPIDLIPDYLPAVGLIDDSALVGWLFQKLGDKLNQSIQEMEQEKTKDTEKLLD
ncbi:MULTISPECIES: YkvA family protein [unclassified Bacteroides]|uniref:YkvA family protein n=1 Tax=unclassified Bacteroides TaxID=2646097 RepID=UPI000B3752EC|nr:MULTISPECIES: YkvA family protein [unclassified Bacteroides]OUO81702.1 hypothetical protein B5F71_05660 [Bacteroides sp. An269]OUP31196.1 hypothetical protein B5F25_11940 [Bacteroides sp. An19]